MERLNVGAFFPLQAGTVVVLENVQGYGNLEINTATSKAVLMKPSNAPSQQFLVEGGPDQWSFKNIATGRYLTAPMPRNGIDFTVNNEPHRFKVRSGSRRHSYIIESAQYANIMLCNSYGRKNDGNRVWTWLWAQSFHDMMSWIPKSADEAKLPPGAPGAAAASQEGPDPEALKKREAELTKLEADLKKREEDVSKSKSDLDADRASVDKTKADLEKRASDLEKRDSDLEKQASDLTTREKSIASRESERPDPPSASSSEEVAELQAQVATLKQKLDEAEKSSPPQDSIKQPPQQSEQPAKGSAGQEGKIAEKISQLQAQNRALTEQLGQVKADLAITKAFSSSSSASGPAPAEFEAQIRSLAQELASTRAQLAAAQAGVASSAQDPQPYDGPAAVRMPPQTNSTPAKHDGASSGYAESGGSAELASKLDEVSQIVTAIRQTQLACLGDRFVDGYAGGSLGGGDGRRDAAPASQASGISPKAGVNGAEYGHDTVGTTLPVEKREFTFLRRL